MQNVAVIGLGHWGPNYLRVFNSLPDCRLVAAVDASESRCESLQSAYPDVTFSTDAQDVIGSPDVDAVVIAVPSSLHYEIASQALAGGKHVLCEKPLTTIGGDAWKLVSQAKDSGCVLMTGHIFLFNPGIQYLSSSVRERVLGNLYYLSSIRTNLGPFRHDVNAAWDLASHDIYIFNHILQQRPVSVSALGGSYLQAGIEDVVFMTLKYPNGVLAHVRISWLDPKKVRQITLVGEIKMMTWDESGSPGPIMVFDRSVVREQQYSTFGEFQLLTREGDVTMPRIQACEPLSAQAREFLSRCEGKNSDSKVGSGTEGAEVVNILEAATKSLKEEGQLVEINYGG